MEQLSLANKKFFSFSLIFIVSFMLIFGVNFEAALAQTLPPPSAEVVNTGGVNVDGTVITTDSSNKTQAQTTQTGNQKSSAAQKSGEGIVSGVGGCAASIVGSAVSSLVGNLLGGISSSDTYTRLNVTGTDQVAHSGNSIGFPPSLDSIGYCIINAVIAYITQATIDWINSGFDGNPAFVDNPEKFFGDLANVEAAGFLQQVVGQTTGLNICQPFRLNIVTGLAAGTGNAYARQSSCTLDTIAQAAGASGVTFDYNEYTSGNSRNAGNLDAWWKITQNDQNNVIGANFQARKEFDRRLSVKQNTAQLDLTAGRGFLSYKKCEPDTSVPGGPDGKPVVKKGKCEIKTPGSVIEQQLNNRLSSGNNRLVLADKFDQVITALVNQLIKVALNKVLEK